VSCCKRAVPEHRHRQAETESQMGLITTCLVAKDRKLRRDDLDMLISAVTLASNLVIPVMIATICVAGYIKKVKIYETFIEGAKEGFNVAVRLIPFLVGMFVAIGIFRESGGLSVLTGVLSPVARQLYMPEELLPLALIRPLSGTGALEVAIDLIRKYGLILP